MLGNKVAILIDEFDFSGGFFSAETEHKVEEKDSTTFGALATSAEPGLASDRLMLRGYYSGNQAGAMFNAVRTRVGAAGNGTCIAVIVDTDDANSVADCSANGWAQNLKVQLAAKELITFEINTAAGGDMASGLVILNATVNATGNQPAVDFGAAGVDGGVVFVFVQAIGGSASNAQIKVQSATTQGGSYSDKATVTFSDVGGYHVVMTDAINRWIRVNVASVGGATSLKLVVIVGVKGVNY